MLNAKGKFVLIVLGILVIAGISVYFIVSNQAQTEEAIQVDSVDVANSGTNSANAELLEGTDAKTETVDDSGFKTKMENCGFTVSADPSDSNSLIAQNSQLQMVVYISTTDNAAGKFVDKKKELKSKKASEVIVDSDQKYVASYAEENRLAVTSYKDNHYIFAETTTTNADMMESIVYNVLGF